MTEEWRSLPKWEGLYEVSNHGGLRSLPRVVNCMPNGKPAKRTVKGQVRSGHVNKSNGYMEFTLSYPRDGGKQRSTVGRGHRMVALAFLGLDPEDSEIFVDHKDGDRTNNHINNLRLVSHQENMWFSGPAYRVLCEQHGQEEADLMIREYITNKDNI